jgi:flavin reductase (DIM6/NTAB) family NADH-FMN oxidoreductase RutF
MPCQDAEFRKAMRLLASGVTVVATAHNGQRSGLTATAVCSLALAPSRILACINVAGYTYELLSRSRRASVNVLAEDQQPVADRFAGRAGDTDSDSRFVGADWRSNGSGVPLLVGALAALDCSIVQMSVLDTHAILIGVVENAVFGPLRRPLIHFDAAYTTSPLPAAAAAPLALDARNANYATQ